MSTSETNASEPLMMCRNSKMTPKPGRMDGPGLGQTEPVDGLSGVRHEGGVTLVQASMRNVGTCRRDAKGDVQAGNPGKNLSTEAWHRGGVARSRNEGAVMVLDRRGGVVRQDGSDNRSREDQIRRAKPFEGTVDDRSRMNREIHVRFWEGLGVRFPRATHLLPPLRWTMKAKALGS